MKKIGILFGIASIVILTSCSNAKTESEQANDTIVETVEVPVETEKSSTTTTTTTTQKNDDGTEIEVDENGVVLSNKAGGSSTRVKVTTDSTKIKIRR
ncbi:MAG: hypothetical protein ACKVQB_13095 [Bacteroidia bacterium]